MGLIDKNGNPLTATAAAPAVLTPEQEAFYTSVNDQLADKGFPGHHQ
jgi:hypothetical protein